MVMAGDKDGYHETLPGDDGQTVDLDQAHNNDAPKEEWGNETVWLDDENAGQREMPDGEDAGQTVMLNEEAGDLTVILDRAIDALSQPAGIPKIRIGRCQGCMREFDPDEEICPYCGFKRNTPPKEAYHLYPGMVLKERYSMGTVVGFGGFGILYRAWDNKLGIMVAIKEYYPAGIVTRVPGEKEVILFTGRKKEEYRKGLARFLDEARNTAKFNNLEHVVHVFDFFEENRTAYMVMEFLDGISFKDEIKRENGRVSWQRGVEVAFVVMEALKSIHKAGIIHRDISPDNIFICRDGMIKVLDFGAARFSDGSGEKDLTKVLKLGFAPPEQYRTKSRQGPWTDVYALGATIYRAVTGVMPEDSSDRERKDLLKPPKEMNGEIPDYVNRAILKAMALMPEYRFQNVEEFRKALANEKPAKELEKEIGLRRRFRLASICLVIAILTAIGAGGWRIYRNRQMEATLDGVSLRVWVMAEQGAEEEQEIFQAAVREFQTAYPNLGLTVEYVEQDYREKLEKALENGTGPDLFESSGIRSELEGYMESADSLFSLINREEYYFLEQYEEYYPERKKVPLGFDMEIDYKNTLLEQEGSNQTPDYEPEDFLNGKAAGYRGTVKDYFQIQDVLSGYYEVEPWKEERVRGAFCDEWSINASSERFSQTAGIRLLYYLLGENGQNALYVEHHGVIPLNKAVADIWWEIYGELGFTKEKVSELDMAGGFVSDRAAGEADLEESEK